MPPSPDPWKHARRGVPPGREYYAHPRNSFWKILGALLDFDPRADYRHRVWRVTESGIAVWDVMHSCRRTGSGDSEIDPSSIRLNDLPAFLRQHAGIVAIGFNGGLAERCFLRQAAPRLNIPTMARIRLPSTSPAYASLSFAEKLARWRVVMEHL